MYISKDVSKALKNNLPVVALESTIISHGMPYPQNVQTALMLENIILKSGATPATIGIIDGEIIVGMNHSQIEEFGKRKDVRKVSRRDLPVVVANKRWGATTVAATMIIAEMAGIEVFVTGGIGGVHRHAETTFDVSADLEEFATTNVTVVSSGAKAILDLPLTLEYLETKGVTVLSYQSDEFASFYSRESGLKLEDRIDTPEEAATIIKTKRDLHLRGGILISNPIPSAFAMSKSQIDEAISLALERAETKGIKGKDVTPFLLKEIATITKGKSLETNIELIKNNAVLGAEVAIALSALKH
ncbi:MAG: pseudouridine-5'-phosphate glycosidase [Bacilli bacterium]|jgi:pseudouridine-5'-phosphate glycosidase|nr:pseudouridine-5'-phosphate glycosidase [Bacilli bacterium]MDD4005541.1 pseudouridine-5'-phosphate glycosidase [Bacilli bacterium]